MADSLTMARTRRPIRYFPFLLVLAIIGLGCGDLSASLLDKLKKQLSGDDQQEQLLDSD